MAKTFCFLSSLSHRLYRFEVEVKNSGQKSRKTVNLAFRHLKLYSREVRLVGIPFKISHQLCLQTTEASSENHPVTG